jgi:hypothetical protein
MTKDNSTGKNKDFYDLGKKKFDQIRVLPEHQAIPQIPQERSSKYMTVFELIEANGLTLHGDIEHFAELVRADEREACAKVCDAVARQMDDEGEGPTGNIGWVSGCAEAIRARGNT